MKLRSALGEELFEKIEKYAEANGFTPLEYILQTLQDQLSWEAECDKQEASRVLDEPFLNTLLAKVLGLSEDSIIDRKEIPLSSFNELFRKYLESPQSLLAGIKPEEKCPISVELQDVFNNEKDSQNVENLKKINPTYLPECDCSFCEDTRNTLEKQNPDKNNIICGDCGNWRKSGTECPYCNSNKSEDFTNCTCDSCTFMRGLATLKEETSKPQQNPPEAATSPRGLKDHTSQELVDELASRYSESIFSGQNNKEVDIAASGNSNTLIYLCTEVINDIVEKGLYEVNDQKDEVKTELQ